MNLKRGLDALVRELPSLQTERRDELEEGLRSLGKKRTFIKGMDEPKEELTAPR
jgi:hypothetical protein